MKINVKEVNKICGQTCGCIDNSQCASAKPIIETQLMQMPKEIVLNRQMANNMPDGYKGKTKSSLEYMFTMGFENGINYQDAHHTASLSVNKQPEKEVDTIEQAAEITPINLGVKNGIDPCPLCGGKEGETVLLGYKEPRYLITCTDCNLTVIDDRKDKVQGKWNTRNGIDFWDKQSWLREVKSTHVPIEEVEKIIGEILDLPYTPHIGILISRLRKLIKPQ